MLRNMTPGQMSPQEIERDLQATLAACREMGAEYDDHFVDSFMSKVDAYITQRLKSARIPARQPAGRASAGQQRLALAIVSISVLVPLVAIAIALPDGLLAFGLACGAIALINFFFAVRR